MSLLALSAKGLRRDMRAADVRALFLALALAVAASTMIGFFLDRIDRALTRQAGQLLGGDLVLEQGSPFDVSLRHEFESAGLMTSTQVDLVSMLSHEQAFQPVSVKVVDDAYPLYGQVRITRDQGEEVVAHGPPPGTLWAAPRLAGLLDVAVGDQVRIGSATLTLDAFIQREPDQQAGFASFNPRVMMNRSDLEATELIRPGSRVEYELLARGAPSALAAVENRLQALEAQGVRIQDVREDRPRLGSALARAEKYLSLAGLAAVLLAGVAVAMATRRYVDRHLDTAALLRCFGGTQRQLAQLFSLQLLWLAMAASLIGALLGLVGQAGLLTLLTRFLPLELPPPGPLPLLMGVLTALAVLVGFAGPTLLRLQRVSALKVLRRELDPLPASAWAVVAAASLVFAALLWLYSGDLALSAGLLAGGLVALSLLWLLGRGLLAGVLRLAQALPGNGAAGAGRGQALRLGARQLARRRQASLGQLLAFAVTFAAMAMIALVRGDLLTTWQAQLPENTPNYFAINIQPAEREPFNALLEGRTDEPSVLYPMVRGRISAINGEPPRDAVPEEQRDANALRRELNLTWRDSLPEGNRLVAGAWFDTLPEADAETAAAPISMELGLAERLGLSLGDQLAFTIGSQEVTGEITSLRSLDWESFKPNFFVIFPPGVLERFGHSYITAFHLEEDRQALVSELVQQFPGISLLNVDAILEQVRDLLAQVTRAVEFVLGFVLLAGISVLYAAMTASRPMRAHESALLRAFGAGNRLISHIQAAEFGLLGLVSGLMGALLAEAAAAGVYLGWLGMAPRWHWGMWLIMPLGGALIIGVIGHLLSRGVRRQTPMDSLRLLGEV
ncbi:ABC transporter permease [Halomonas sp. WWR20]